MLRTAILIVLFFVAFSSTLRAENPWGPECATLDECLAHVMKMPECPPGDDQCFFNLDQDGLSMEFWKFGRSAVPPLLELLKSGNATFSARAADLLRLLDKHILPDEGEIILDAWRRGVIGVELLATRFATPDFAREVMKLLRKDPRREGYLGNTFSNFRDWDEKPNGVFAAISEHIECSEGEPCEPRFAKLQIEWLVSNAGKEEDISDRLIQAIENPKLDTPGKIAALEYFRPNIYTRPKDNIKDIAVRLLRKKLRSEDREVSFEAANILLEFDDASGVDTLVAIAGDRLIPSFKRIRVLQTLSRFADFDRQKLAMFRMLLDDADWDFRRHTVILLGAMGGDDVVDVLIDQIRPGDWLTSYSAVSALGRMPNRKARSVVQQVAANYWHPIVREAANGAMSRDTNLEQYPASERTAVQIANSVLFKTISPLSEEEDSDIGRWCSSRLEADGYMWVSDAIASPAEEAEADNASQFNVTRFRNSLLKLKVMKGAVSPGLKLAFGDWTFTGTASAEGTGRLVVNRPNGPPQVLVEKSIAAVFMWNDQPYAITGSKEPYPDGYGYLLKLSQAADQSWTAVPVLRLTGNPEVWLAPDQTIGILGTGISEGAGVMLIHRDGTPEWVGCPQPHFP